jgi:ribosomal protein S18 acetylase RimI-like enzyme
MKEVMHNIEMISYDPQLAEYFKTLNIAWIEKYFSVEGEDELVLGNPEVQILQKGGYIFFAKSDGQIAGTFALIKTGGKEFELAKMAVSENFQGKKIGNKMLACCIDHLKSIGAEKVVLFSNRMLKPALHLYEKFGFREVPLEHSAYLRSNIKMELDLKAYHEQD